MHNLTNFTLLTFQSLKAADSEACFFSGNFDTTSGENQEGGHSYHQDGTPFLGASALL
jgi:hypothetical protein